MKHRLFTKETIPRGLDNISFEVLQLQNQLQLLDDIFEEQLLKQQKNKQGSCCAKWVAIPKNFFCFKYYENFLHKLGYCKGKEE